MSHEDPLAELARLVGKDDPFRALARRSGSNVAQFPQAVPARPVEDDGGPERADFREFDAEPQDHDERLRAAPDTRHHGDAQADLHFTPVENSVEAFEPALGYPTAGGRGEAPTLNPDLWAEGALPQAGPTGDLFQDRPHEERDNRTPRRTLVVLAAVLALTAGGLGATFFMHDGSGVRLGGGAPPTIMAADTPVKVQSPDVANGNAPDANTALLEKTGSDKVDNAKVVTSNEQPVDLNQLPKATSGQADAQPQASASPSPFPEPRKVKTVMIRPDGSVMGEAAQAPAPATQPVGMVLPTEAGGPVPTAPETVARPSTPKSTVRASTTPTSPAGGASGAKSAATAPHPAKPVVVASTASDDAAPTPATAPGTWSVQLGAPPSEQEAKDMMGRLQKKFAGELGGLKPGIVKADKDGKPIYRVRVGNLAQADAKALCAKLQGGGGSCFAVRN